MLRLVYTSSRNTTTLIKENIMTVFLLAAIVLLIAGSPIPALGCALIWIGTGNH